MGEGMRIHLEVYLPFRGHNRWAGEEVVPAGMTAGALLSYLGVMEPELVVLVGGRYVNPTTFLSQGDQVFVLRQAAGG